MAGRLASGARAGRSCFPIGRRLLVGTDILERERLASRLRTAMLWGSACACCSPHVIRLRLQPARASARQRDRGHVRNDHGWRSVAAPARSKDRSDEFDELVTTVNRMLETHRAADRHAAHDVRQRRARPARATVSRARPHRRVAAASDSAATTRETMEATLAELDRVQRTLGTLLQIAQADGRGTRCLRRSPWISPRSRASWSSCISRKRRRAGSPSSMRRRGCEDSRQQSAARAGARESDRERTQVRSPGGRIDVSVAAEPDARARSQTTGPASRPPIDNACCSRSYGWNAIASKWAADSA